MHFRSLTKSNQRIWRVDQWLQHPSNTQSLTCSAGKLILDKGMRKLTTRFEDHEVFRENCNYSRNHLKARIIKSKIIEYKCSICDLPPIWRGKPMTLILDHINGINNDNRLCNLRFVCSNCDCQLDTYKSKNRKK